MFVQSDLVKDVQGQEIGPDGLYRFLSTQPILSLIYHNLLEQF